VTKGEDQVTIELLLKPAGSPPVSGAPPRPGPDTVERVCRDLSARGLVCHATPYGLVCSAPRALLDRVLGPGAGSAAPGASLPVPAHLADVVEQITVEVRPEFFP
jgi:hypothetical protein